MIKIPDNCTGCTACASICPKGCISMSDNKEGFKYPSIDVSSCIDCDLCTKVCPAINMAKPAELSKVYVAQNSDVKTLQNSSSGGVFSAIAKHILDQKGVVYGAAMDYDNMEVRHVRIDNVENLHAIMGSKYVQSNLTGIFELVKKNLTNGIKVLFSGTPCQIAGLKNYLRKEDDNLLTVDLICHGVPSPGIFKTYIQEVLSNKGSMSNKRLKITNISFRDKKNGWNGYGFSIHCKDIDTSETTYEFWNRYDNTFMRAFLDNLILRNSCADCPSKNFKSGADITIGDAWGLGNYLYSTTIENGYSLIIPHNSKALNILRTIDCNLTEVKDIVLTKHNATYQESIKPHKRRARFFKMVNNGCSVHDAVDKCLPAPTYMDKIVWSIKRRLQK